ncbi:sirohydrochlorin ferrochelatase, chloroplastic isoform X2 [Phalaenopsis equestris]|uniref:sirohydrochlorin ferrochelatase, chloroplastic isoform X2 n=1 Tax=Phalaenopsis equestris TaxID=78828 RepID=UPI0009E206EE|nr:sirohydrochlorin ferrochelatase, chloroplastic isoform X2 [Phalaenopsis equestris]
MQSVSATSEVPLTRKFYKAANTSAPTYKKNQHRLYFSYFTIFERLPRRTIFPIKSSLSIMNDYVLKGEPTNQVKDGVVIVDHGSRRQESNHMLNDFVAMFKSRTGYQVVEPAHMELAEPTIKDAFRLCVQQGANHIIISPFFLLPGRHWYKDIPALVAEAAGEYSGISYIITAPLGLHELMVDVMNERIQRCLSHVAGKADECSMCAGTGRCHLY